MRAKKKQLLKRWEFYYNNLVCPNNSFRIGDLCFFFRLNLGDGLACYAETTFMTRVSMDEPLADGLAIVSDTKIPLKLQPVDKIPREWMNNVAWRLRQVRQKYRLHAAAAEQRNENLYRKLQESFKQYGLRWKDIEEALSIKRTPTGIKAYVIHHDEAAGQPPRWTPIQLALQPGLPLVIESTFCTMRERFKTVTEFLIACYFMLQNPAYSHLVSAREKGGRR